MLRKTTFSTLKVQELKALLDYTEALELNIIPIIFSNASDRRFLFANEIRINKSTLFIAVVSAPKRSNAWPVCSKTRRSC